MKLNTLKILWALIVMPFQKNKKQSIESDSEMLYNKNTTFTTYNGKDETYSPNTTWKLMWKE